MIANKVSLTEIKWIYKSIKNIFLFFFHLFLEILHKKKLIYLDHKNVKLKKNLSHVSRSNVRRNISRAKFYETECKDFVYICSRRTGRRSLTWNDQYYHPGINCCLDKSLIIGEMTIVCDYSGESNGLKCPCGKVKFATNSPTSRSITIHSFLDGKSKYQFSEI